MLTETITQIRNNLKQPRGDKGRIAIMRLLSNWRRELTPEQKTKMFDAIAEATRWKPAGKKDREGNGDTI